MRLLKLIVVFWHKIVKYSKKCLRRMTCWTYHKMYILNLIMIGEGYLFE